MVRQLGLATAALAAFALVAPAVQAEKKAVKPVNSWMGSVEDEKLKSEAKEVITDAKAFEALWKAWKIEGKLPEVDFKKQFVAVQTTSGSKLNVSGNFDTDKGDLQILGLATRDLVPGFRYVICTFDREGVKTVNGKELK